MAANALFYQSIVALDSNIHSGKRVISPEQDASFARDSHLIPAIIDEFSAAAYRFPILFASSGKQTTPVFLVGRRPGENAFVDADGKWTGSYVPAYIRRYPFIIGEIDEKPSIVCFDERSTLFDAQDGEPLFADGQPTGFLEGKISYLNQYLDGARRTEQFCEILVQHDLLSPADINFQDGAGHSSSIYGLMVVNEERLNDLSDEIFAKLRSENIIVLIYAHLFSLRSVEGIGQNTRASGRALEVEPTLAG